MTLPGALAAAPLTFPPWASRYPPAPGDLRLVHAFVNTFDVESGAESWTDPPALARWLASWGLVAADSPAGAATLRDAIALREGLRSILAGHAGEELEAADATKLEGVVARLPLRIGIDPDGRPRALPAVDGVAGALARVLVVAAEAAADGRWERLKVCRRSDCRWAFYDFSKNRRGRWCSMKSCGNPIAARAYRRRRAALAETSA